MIVAKRNKTTLKSPKFSNVSIFIDVCHDTQGRTLAFAYHVTTSKITKKQTSSKKMKDKYITTIAPFSPELELKEYINFLINLHRVLEYYENAEKDEDANWGPVTYAIYYWNKEVRDWMNKLFVEVLMKFANLNFKDKRDKEDLELLRTIFEGAIASDLEDQKDEIQKMLARFNVFFKAEDQLKDYRAIENNPFFSLLDTIEDLFVIDSPYNLNLLALANMIKPGPRPPYLGYYKPDSDNFNGKFFAKAWETNLDGGEQRAYLETVVSQVNQRLYALRTICFNLRAIDSEIKLKANAPAIPFKSTVQNYNVIKHGNDIVLAHMLEVALSNIEADLMHSESVDKKVIFSKSLMLDHLIEGEQRDTILSDVAKEQVKHYLVYKVNEKSVDVKIDTSSFFLTLYPYKHDDYLTKRFTTNSQYKNNILLDDEAFAKAKFQSKDYLYKHKIRTKLVKLDRFNLEAVLEIEEPVYGLMDYLTANYRMDFKRSVIVEEVYVDHWENKLTKIIKAIGGDFKLAAEGKKMFEQRFLAPTDTISAEQLTHQLAQVYGADNILLDNSQFSAVLNFINHRLSILWGPPGTGKTSTLLKLIAYYFSLRKPFKLLLLGNYDATANILKKIAQEINAPEVGLYRLYSKGRGSIDLHTNTSCYVEEIECDGEALKAFQQSLNKKGKGPLLQVYAVTPDQYYKVFIQDIKRNKFTFDVTIIDEASQLTVGRALPAFLRMNENSKLIIAGDHLQLPPIMKAKVNHAEQYHWGSIFNYFHKMYGEDPSIFNVLKLNRRSSRGIVDYSIKAFGYPEDYRADDNNADRKVQYVHEGTPSTYFQTVLHPEHPIALVKYKGNYSLQANELEEQRIVELVCELWQRGLVIDGKQIGLIDFFEKGIGVVVPHRAQRNRIQNGLVKYFTTKKILQQQQIEQVDDFIKKINSSVDTVEKYQGQEREVIIAGYVASDTEFIAAEEEFLFNPNRLNVMVSRARAKAIIFIADEVLNHLTDDYEIVQAKKSLDTLVRHCSKVIPLTSQDWATHEAEVFLN